MDFLELYAADNRLFQAKILFAKKLVTLSEEAQFIWIQLIWTNSDSRDRHKK